MGWFWGYLYQNSSLGRTNNIYVMMQKASLICSHDWSQTRSPCFSFQAHKSQRALSRQQTIPVLLWRRSSERADGKSLSGSVAALLSVKQAALFGLTFKGRLMSEQFVPACSTLHIVPEPTLCSDRNQCNFWKVVIIFSVPTLSDWLMSRTSSFTQMKVDKCFKVHQQCGNDGARADGFCRADYVLHI